MTVSLFSLARGGDVAALRDRLATSDSPAVRRRAAELLSDVVDREDVAELEVADGAAGGDGADATADDDGSGGDSTDPDGETDAVAGTEVSQTVEALVAAATGDDDPRVRGAAIDTLNGLGEGPRKRLLAALTATDPGATADWVAAKRYVRALSADRPELRMTAANALGDVGDGSVVPALVDALDDSDLRVRARAAHALGQIGDPRAVDPLAARLEADDEMLRRAAADALGSLATDRALAALLDLLEDDTESLRRLAASALGNASSAEPVAALTAALDDESGPVRRAAVFSIIELLSNVPTERSHRVRERVVDELSAADDETVVAPLVEILDESVQARQRRNAAWFLGRVTGEDPPRPAVDALVETLEAADDQTAQFAATSLAEMAGRAVESALLDLLDSDASEAARAQAAYVLGQVGDDRARERLDRLTEEADSKEVRRRAFAALSKLGGHR